MKQARVFEFDRFEVSSEGDKVSFHYKIHFEDNSVQTFTEILSLPVKLSSVDEVTKQLAERILEDVHLILGISYFKLYCPKEILVNSAFLTQDQAFFWDIVYTKGLGEFFYKNKLDFRKMIQFPAGSDIDESPIVCPLKDRSLLGIGGGKDSIVSADLLQSNDKQFAALYNDPQQSEVAKLLGVEKFQITRLLDPTLSVLNKTGDVYNGHIPISAIWAFIGILYAVLLDYRYFIVSNERSSNYGSIDYLGMPINHQWSKSFQFENLFTEYTASRYGDNVSYFSLLRPFYEIEIVRRFSNLPKYFSTFTSCNRNFTQEKQAMDGLWCGNCSKCAFVFCLLSAFLEKSKLTEIFGGNLYADPKLVDTYRELLGVKDIKPFVFVAVTVKV
jgi:hypothetical protein